ncbi:putative ADP-ribosylation factor GTPase-activating protein AGD14 isoform X2 [Carex littledalei]|uniref:Putative ADP-ribosylation factor GTPase-activating protein AGD14 isoform X2 n=1 Tax=Carex littledalei TaxID=544730 RepID=A0A833QN87_9POAL|nr:putative ADP-ribosylation factor GTPase-activating protein AGD14 isoform X2 [Carex littledalei]
MISKKEEERNEKIIRGLLKLPPNRRCINCNSMGPQYVCTNFWTFVCVTCSGIHREFTHRVKSVSMAKFTSQEVDALQKGGNQRAREIYLKDCDPMQMKLPDSSNADNIREFIKSVYVDKKYTGGTAFEKPPRDTQNHKKQTEDHRRASSYHSYSQSPPYDYQYEERLYGKQPAMLTRKPGSDKGNYEGKLASFLSSSLSQPEQTYDERFGNESCGSRVSDFSASSPGDPFVLAGQSPNFQDLHSKSNPNGTLHTKRTASSGSIGSFDSASFKSADSGAFADASCDLFDELTLQKPATVSPDPPIDLFAHANSQPSSENVGWATFDSPPIKSPPHTNGFNSSHKVPSSNETFAPLTELFSGDFNGPISSSDLTSNNAQAWNAFEDTSSSMASEHAFSGFDKIEIPYSATSNSQSWLSFENNSGNAKFSEPSTAAQEPQTTKNPFAIDDTSEVLPTKVWVQNSTIEELPNLTNPFDGVAELFPSAVVPLEGGNLEESLSTNPFDIPIGTHSDALSMFMDMGSLQAALPDPRVPDAFLEAVSGYSTSFTQGVMTCLASQAPSSPFQYVISYYLIITY